MKHLECMFDLIANHSMTTVLDNAEHSSVTETTARRCASLASPNASDLRANVGNDNNNESSKAYVINPLLHALRNKVPKKDAIKLGNPTT